MSSTFKVYYVCKDVAYLDDQFATLSAAQAHVRYLLAANLRLQNAPKGIKFLDNGDITLTYANGNQTTIAIIAPIEAKEKPQ